MYSEKELENVSRGCLLAGALLDFAKARARASGAAAELRFFGAGRDRFLLDLLHERFFRALADFKPRLIIEESVRALAAEFALRGAPPGAFWTGLAADFAREYDAGRVRLLEVSWE